jgi:hypothetical protein
MNAGLMSVGMFACSPKGDTEIGTDLGDDDVVQLILSLFSYNGMF